MGLGSSTRRGKRIGLAITHGDQSGATRELAKCMLTNLRPRRTVKVLGFAWLLSFYSGRAPWINGVGGNVNEDIVLCAADHLSPDASGRGRRAPHCSRRGKRQLSNRLSADARQRRRFGRADTAGGRIR